MRWNLIRIQHFWKLPASYVFFLRACVQQVWFLCARNEILFARAHKHKALPQVQQHTRRCNDPAVCAAHVVCPQLHASELFQFRVMQQQKRQPTFEQRDCLRREEHFANAFLTDGGSGVAEFHYQPYLNAQHMFPIEFTLWVMNSKHEATLGIRGVPKG